MSSRHIADRFLPDKAIDLVDEAASRVRLKAFTAPPNPERNGKMRSNGFRRKRHLPRSQDFENAAKIRDKEKELQILLDEEKEKWKNSSSHDVKRKYQRRTLLRLFPRGRESLLISSPRRKVKSFLIWSRLCMKELLGRIRRFSSIARAIRRVAG